MKTNRISKLVIFTLISMWSLSSFSQNQYIEFSLKCKVKVDYSDHTGFRKVDITEVVVEVNEYPKHKSIFLKSANEFANNISISVPPPPPRNGSEIKSYDSSDENKYELTSNSTTSRNTSTSSMIYINRNNGEIIVTSEFLLGKGMSQTSVGGICEKIDKTKKKF